MIENISLNINYESISTSPNSISSGEIFFQFEELSFPEQNWNDFIDVILNWWLEELIQFVQGNKLELHFSFMDGPFSVRMKNKDRDVVEYSLIVDSQGTSIRTGEVSVEALRKDIEMKINELLRYCDERNLHSDEFDKLKANFTRLQLTN